MPTLAVATSLPRVVTDSAAHLQVVGADGAALQRRHYFLHDAHVKYLDREIGRKTKWRAVTRRSKETVFTATPSTDGQCKGAREAHIACRVDGVAKHGS